MLVLLTTILLCIITVVLFINLSPVFGGSASSEQKATYLSSENYQDGKFVNSEPVDFSMDFKDVIRLLGAYVSPPPLTIPTKSLPMESADSVDIAQYHGGSRLLWFGHSTFLLQLNGKNILLDPMLGRVPAPHPWLGSNRFTNALPIDIEKLPSMDAVIISHDHYDHLDYSTIISLKDRVRRFYVPLGVGVHLVKWGVKESKITELDWWQETEFSDLTLVCTPARHFSGRKLNTRSTTLWSSWIITSAEENIFVSGDSGYGPHFVEIGNKYGPFDFAMLECGQYNELWPDVHMFPEETAQAGIDLRAQAIMPIHWGAFKLSTHPWNEPIERVTRKAKKLNIKVASPRIGEFILLNSLKPTADQWWKL